MQTIRSKHHDFLGLLGKKLEEKGERLISASFGMGGSLDIILTNEGHVQQYTLAEDQQGVFFYRTLGFDMSGHNFT